MRGVPLLLLVPLVACAGPSAPPDDFVNEHIPPFARVPYEPLSRNAVVAIALREWRLFGAPVDDNPPGTYRPTTPEDKPERQQGLCGSVSANTGGLGSIRATPDVGVDRQT